MAAHDDERRGQKGGHDEHGTREMVDLALELETEEHRRRALIRLLDGFEEGPSEQDGPPP